MASCMKKALVTGASRGIGAAISRALAADGWMVAVNYLNSAEKAVTLAEEIGGTAICADVSNPEAAAQMVHELGKIDLLINNAGISKFGLLTDIADEDWERIFSINVSGIKNCCRAVIPQMVSKKSGNIINISSVWGVLGASCEVAYSASKAAVIGMTKALAKELGPSGIRVNCICPGVIETDMISIFSDEEKAELAENTALGRIGLPGDVANLAVFLASEKSSFMTGQIIGVDGGFPL
jgi:Dehydrogenases with different specificities (related to short-chain alcohol dehydrogenases)